jgi:acetolactate synthase regulatory subunit
MTHDFKLAVSRVEGVLLRVLGLSVRRGYEPVEVSATPASEPGVMDLRLRVESTRPADALARQLLKLYEVRFVQVLS